MALINCPECNKEISDNAKVCPQCGHPLKKAKGKQKNKVLIFIIIFILILILGIGSFAIFKYIQNKPTREKVKTCFELIEDVSSGKAKIKKIYSYDDDDDIIVVKCKYNGTSDMATINLENNTCGFESEFQELAEKVEKAEANGTATKKMYQKIIDCEFDVMVYQKFLNETEDFTVIYDD